MAALKAALIFLFFVSAAIAVDIRPDLSGTWVPDATNSSISKKLKAGPDSNTPPAPPPPPQGSIYPSEKIEQKGTNVKISTLDEAGKTTSTLVLSADGMDKVNQMDSVIHKSVTLWEERRLITDWKLERNGSVVMTGRDIRELSEDENTLILRKHTEDSKSTSDSTILFRKAVK